MNEFSQIDPDRRTMLKGVASLPLATILANPAFSQEVAATLETITTTLPNGDNVTAYLAVPDTLPAPAIMLVHEWWGLKDEVKAVAAEFAKEGYLALAIDLYKGKVATTVPEALAARNAVFEEREVSDATVSAWVDWLKTNERSTGKVGTLGWCFGGGWSLNASILNPVDATVIYYGNVEKTAEEVASLKGDVLGHFGTLDRLINPEMVAGFEASMNEAGKTHTIHMYEANHAFSNPTGQAYDEEDAKLAWSRTMEFLNAKLK
jgi:carboxymethylenebutenolidase